MAISTFSHRLGGRCVRMVLVAGLCAGVAGCDNRDGDEALNKAHSSIQSMAPGNQHAGGALTSEGYETLKTNLASIEGSDAAKASAMLLQAQASAGLAGPIASEAADLERECLNDYQLLRSLLTNYLTSSTLSEAAGAYNPAPELSEIEKQVQARDQELSAAQTKKDEVDGRVNALRSQSNAKTQQARQLREQAATLKGGIGNATAVEGEQLTKQARELSRQADALDVDASNLEADAARIAPEATHAQLDIDRITTQKQLLAQAKAGIDQRAAQSRARAGEHREKANQIAGEIREIVTRVEARRSGDLTRKSDEAIAGYETAAGQAGQAARAVEGTAQVAAGSFHQSAGSMHWGRAQGLEAYASVMEALATAQPALPESGGYGAAAQAARAQAKESLDKATEAYRAANDAYQSVGGSSEEVRARIDGLNRLLADAAKLTSNGAVDIRVQPEATPEAAPTEGGEAAPAAADASTPNGAIAVIKAASDGSSYEEAARHFYFAEDANGQALKSFLDAIGPGFSKLSNAMKAKFGDEAVKALEGAGGGGGMMSSGLEGVDPASLQFEINGEVATATGPDGKPITLRNVGGEWKLDIMASMPPEAAAAIPMMGPMGSAMGKAAQEVAAEVESGQITSPEAAMQALQAKMMQAMQGGG